MPNMYDVNKGSFLVVTEEMNQKALKAINTTWHQVGRD